MGQSRIGGRFKSGFRNLPLCLQTSLAPFSSTALKSPRLLTVPLAPKAAPYVGLCTCYPSPRNPLPTDTRLAHVSPQRDVPEHPLSNSCLSLHLLLLCSTTCLKLNSTRRAFVYLTAAHLPWENVNPMKARTVCLLATDSQGPQTGPGT